MENTTTQNGSQMVGGRIQADTNTQVQPTVESTETVENTQDETTQADSTTDETTG